MSLSTLTSNKVAFGRFLPVLLALLFVGGSDPSHLSGPRSIGDGQPQSTGTSIGSGRVLYANARTALHLLPALLQQSYESRLSRTAPSIAQLPPSLAAALQRLDSVDAEELQPRSATYRAALQQRPPPAV